MSHKKYKVWVATKHEERYVEWLGPEFEHTYNNAVADLIIFTGGTDINPYLYGEKPHSKTDNPDNNRDANEIDDFYGAIKSATPMLGICRGSQLLTVLNGGNLIQHVTSHNGNHKIKCLEGESLSVSSSHHQMMDPSNLEEGIDYEMIAWSENAKSHGYEGGQGKKDMGDNFKEPEILWFPKTKCLCCQSHPEWKNSPTDGKDYVIKLVKTLLLNVKENDKLLTA